MKPLLGLSALFYGISSNSDNTKLHATILSIGVAASLVANFSTIKMFLISNQYESLDEEHNVPCRPEEASQSLLQSGLVVSMLGELQGGENLS